ncbi:unnamed protein product, partial [Ixodes pacificus]
PPSIQLKPIITRRRSDDAATPGQEADDLLSAYTIKPARPATNWEATKTNGI